MITDILDGYNNQIDQLAAIFSGKSPRLKVLAPSRASSAGFAAYVEKLRAVFWQHKPAIEIGEYIGSGGFADVFLASSEYENFHDFVIKILKPGLLKKRSGRNIASFDEEMRIKDLKKRFTNESYVQWALSNSLIETVSQSVVRVFDHGAYDSKTNFNFIVMERLGSTLRNYIDRRRDIPDNHQERLFKSVLITRIAELIRNVHIEGVIHRDIKPENILFAAAEKNIEDVINNPLDWIDKLLPVRIGDFGTVRWMRSSTSRYDAIIIGSQYYMSPEQIFTPGQIDMRTDVYSFGVVAYEILFGAHPKTITHVPGTNLLVRLAHDQPEQRTPPDGFEELYGIIMQCMAPLHKRWQTMQEVLTELRGFCSTLNYHD